MSMLCKVRSSAGVRTAGARTQPIILSTNSLRTSTCSRVNVHPHPLTRQQLRPCPAAPTGSETAAEMQLPLWPTPWSVPRKSIHILEGVILLVILGIVDAAYSGDWSRIGVITKEAETELQQYVLFATAVHAGIGFGSAVLANRADAISPVEGFARGFFFGVTGMFEVFHVTELKLKAAK